MILVLQAKILVQGSISSLIFNNTKITHQNPSIFYMKEHIGGTLDILVQYLYASTWLSLIN